MSKKATILYVPGLGDNYDRFRRRWLTYWKWWGADARLVPMTWYDGHDFDEKYARLDAEIKRHERVILVGESAGGAMVLQAAAKRYKNVIKVATLCGVANPEMPISPVIQRRGPAFLTATRSLKRQLPSEIIHTYVALSDPIVLKKHSHVPEAKRHRVFSIGHFVTIALCLSLYSPWFVHSLTKE